MLRKTGKRRHRRASLRGVAAALLIMASGAAEGAGTVPPELAGKWGFAVATGEYCSDFNHCAPGSGGNISFDFKPDGRASYALFQSALVEGCGEIQSLEMKQGSITVRAGTIVFTPQAGTYKSVNDCRPDLTGTWKFAPDDLKPVSLHWRFEGTSLRITDPSGEASGVYSRR